MDKDRLQANFRVCAADRDMVQNLRRAIPLPSGKVPSETDIWLKGLHELHARVFKDKKGGRK